MSHIEASWQNFGPTLDARDIRASLKDGGHLEIKRVTLALDVWQSLLHLRWQFRDLTFWQLQLMTNTPLRSGDSDRGLETSRISDLFLRQFDHFDLRDSEVSFITLSGQRAEPGDPTADLVKRERSPPRRGAGESLQPERAARRYAGADGSA